MLSYAILCSIIWYKRPKKATLIKSDRRQRKPTEDIARGAFTISAAEVFLNFRLFSGLWLKLGLDRARKGWTRVQRFKNKHIKSKTYSVS